MIPFLQRVAHFLSKEYNNDYEKICVVLPNRRGGLFLRRFLAAETGKVTWAPAIFSIEDFMAEISGLQEIETMHLLFELYGVHREIEGSNAEPFDDFLRWAPQLLSDFNEVDRYLANPEELFSNLTEARAISLWNPDGQPLTEFEQRYLHFFQSLAEYHARLKMKLLAKNQAYQGLGFRQAVENISRDLEKLPWDHIIFAGFNALTKAEERIIRTLKDAGKATVLWDSDHYYLDNPQQEAGDFLRHWKNTWNEKEFRWIFDEFSGSEKVIEITGSPDPVGQVKYCGQILSELAQQGYADERTAVVLLDEGLLIPLLNSLPEEVTALNITAGLPLKQTPFFGLFETIFQMHLHTAQFTYLVASGSGKFYYRDVLNLLQHPYIQKMAQKHPDGNMLAFNEVIGQIRLGHRVFIGAGDVVPKESGLDAASLSFLLPLFTPWNTPGDVLVCFRHVIGALRSGEKDKIELEYLFAFSSLIQQLNNLLADYPSELKIEGFYELFKQAVQGTSLPFYGEPLRGIQVMGMLETRTLDFEHLIILSCNDDLLPSGKNNSSYIPLDIKRNFGLPTYQHKDSVYAYHFYRLIQRSKNIRILYSTEPDQLGGGERSRFLRQITDELPAFNPQITIRESILTTPAVNSGSFPVIEIQKSGDTLVSLEEKAVKGFSASSLNAYRNCPLKFYFSEIASLREPEDVEDTIDPAVLGSAVHAALYKLYGPLKNRPLRKDDYAEMALNVDDAVNNAFENKFKGSDIAYGENLLRVSVAKLMIKRFLQYESEQLEEVESFGGSCTVAMLEHFTETSLNIRYNDKSLSVRLKGVIDRVDIMDGRWRIIDYKTGTTMPGQLKVNDWEDLIREPSLNIGFQLLMYAWLLGKKNQTPAGSSAGIISLKRISAGFTAVSVPDEENVKLTSLIREKETQQFENVLITLLNEIFDTSVPFVQTDDLAICANCPYINLCGR